MAELYFGPHPDGVGLVERAAETASQGLASAGRVIGANDSGALDDSWLPFADAADLLDAEIAAAAILAQTLDGSARVWRWFGFERLSEWVERRALDAVCPVGTVRMAVTAGDSDWWLRLDGRTIGNPDSGAALHGGRYEELFKVLWNGITGAYALKIYNSDGLEVVRGASADNDWLAARRLALPNPAGRTPVATGSAAGLSTRSAGMTGGFEAAAMTQDNLPRHNHVVGAAVSIESEVVDLVTAVDVTSLTVDVAVTSAADAYADTDIGSTTPPSHSHAVSGTTTTANKAEKHTHAVELAAHNHGAGGYFSLAGAPVVIDVEVEEASAGEVDDVELDPHTHNAAASGSLTVASVPVTVTTQPGGAQTVTSADPVAQSGHSHSLAVAVAPAEGSRHTHTAQTRVAVSVSSKATAVPSLKLNTTKLRRTLQSVGSANVRTENAGGGAALSILQPYMAFDFVIRY